MSTSKERWEWLLKFANEVRPSGELKEWEWLKLRDEIREFVLEDTEPFTFEPEDKWEKALTHDAIEKLQATAHFALKEFLHGASDEGTARVVITFGFAPNRLVFSGEISRLFYVSMGLFIAREGLSQIRECPQCHKLFYRIRKQKYCSRTCINRVSRREWLKKPKNKKKERGWAKKRYEARMKAKLGSNVKIQERNKGGKN